MQSSLTGVTDLHLHIAGVGAGESGCHVAPQLRNNWRYKIYLRAFGVTEKELLEYGDALVLARISQQLRAAQSVSAAVVLALDGRVDSHGNLDLDTTEVYIPNDFVARETAHYDNLLFGASVNPYRRDALQLLDKVVDEGAVLLKWLPAIQHIDPADESLVPFYRKLAELQLPLLTHCGNEHSFTTAWPELGDPQRLHLPLSLGVTVIAAHAASTGKSEGEPNMERLLAMFPAHPNLYTDISSLTQLNKLGYLRRLLKHAQFHDRLLYGTDFPLINTLLVSPWYFPRDLKLKQIFAVRRQKNPWDRDVALKRALGTPDAVFLRGGSLLRRKRRVE